MFILLTASHPVLQELFKEHVGFLFVKKTYQASMRSLPGQGIRFVSCLQSGAWAHRSLCVFLCCAGTRGDTWALEWVAGMARGDAALVPAAETPSTAGPSTQGHMKKCFIMTCSSGSAVPGDFLLRLVLSMFITSELGNASAHCVLLVPYSFAQMECLCCIAFHWKTVPCSGGTDILHGLCCKLLLMATWF